MASYTLSPFAPAAIAVDTSVDTSSRASGVRLSPFSSMGSMTVSDRAAMDAACTPSSPFISAVTPASKASFKDLPSSVLVSMPTVSTILPTVLDTAPVLAKPLSKIAAPMSPPLVTTFTPVSATKLATVDPT